MRSLALSVMEHALRLRLLGGGYPGCLRGRSEIDCSHPQE
jgi:hypothetical protein